mgnify:CR=1 FL=1
MTPSTQDLKKNTSIIIPNLDSKVIDQTIKSLLTQPRIEECEIIVVGMDKYGLVENFPEVKFIKTPAPVGAAEARNIGIREAIGDTFIFIDSDCVAETGWLDAYYADFAEGWQVIGGGVKSPTDNFWQLVYNLSMFHEQLWTQPRCEHKYLATLNLAMTREVIEEVGPLNEAFMRGQDIEWTSRMTRAGIRLLFDPAAVIVHQPSRFTFEAVRRDNYRSGYYMIEVRYEHPEIFHMSPILQSSIIWRIFKPLIAAWTTLKIVIKTREVRRNPRIIPHVFRLKAAWCDGAADRLEGKENVQ